MYVKNKLISSRSINFKERLSKHVKQILVDIFLCLRLWADIAHHTSSKSKKVGN